LRFFSKPDRLKSLSLEQFEVGHVRKHAQDRLHHKQGELGLVTGIPNNTFPQNT